MSDERELFRVRLREAQSCVTPFNVKLVKGRDVFVPAGHKHLVYYRRNANMFDVRSINDVPTNRLPRTLLRRQRKEVRTTYNGTIGEDPIVDVIVDQEETAVVAPVEDPPDEPVEEPESDEPSITTSTTVYTESQLQRLKRSELAEIAADFEVDVADKDLKREIIEKIIAAEGE